MGKLAKDLIVAGVVTAIIGAVVLFVPGLTRVLQFEHTDSITKPRVKRLFLCQIS